MMKRRGDYGYDAPYALIAFAVVGIVCLIIAVAAGRSQNRQLARTMTVYAAFGLINALRTLSGATVARRRLGWQFWYGNPFAATSLVTASKSALP